MTFYADDLPRFVVEGITAGLDKGFRLYVACVRGSLRAIVRAKHTAPSQQSSLDEWRSREWRAWAGQRPEIHDVTEALPDLWRLLYRPPNAVICFWWSGMTFVIREAATPDAPAMDALPPSELILRGVDVPPPVCNWPLVNEDRWRNDPHWASVWDAGLPAAIRAKQQQAADDLAATREIVRQLEPFQGTTSK